MIADAKYTATMSMPASAGSSRYLTTASRYRDLLRHMMIGGKIARTATSRKAAPVTAANEKPKAMSAGRQTNQKAIPADRPTATHIAIAMIVRLPVLLIPPLYSLSATFSASCDLPITDRARRWRSLWTRRCGEPDC